ncbi:MAG: hypothetical protein ACYCW6_29555 [Candidatus Xenobia bacterium]
MKTINTPSPVEVMDSGGTARCSGAREESPASRHMAYTCERKWQKTLMPRSSDGAAFRLGVKLRKSTISAVAGTGGSASFTAIIPPSYGAQGGGVLHLRNGAA